MTDEEGVKLLRPPENATGLVVTLNGDVEHAFEAIVDREFAKTVLVNMEADPEPPIPPGGLACDMIRQLLDETAWHDGGELMAGLALFMVHAACERRRWKEYRRRAAQGGWTIRIELEGTADEGSKGSVRVGMYRLVEHTSLAGHA